MEYVLQLEELTLLDILNHIAARHPKLVTISPNAVDLAIKQLQNDLGYGYSVNYAKKMNSLLSQLCDKYGSDKGSILAKSAAYDWVAHTYADHYACLFAHCRQHVKKVFECGIGTNNPDLVSSMGKLGRPGASLRVWEEYFPNALIYGADIDKDILFTEGRIKTGYLDQLDKSTIEQYWSDIKQSDFDLMIDDGLHTYEAGITLFMNSISKLADNGIYVIEDVDIIDLFRYKDYFANTNYVVDYVAMNRPNETLGNNTLVVIRKS